MSKEHDLLTLAEKKLNSELEAPVENFYEQGAKTAHTC